MHGHQLQVVMHHLIIPTDTLAKSLHLSTMLLQCTCRAKKGIDKSSPATNSQSSAPRRLLMIIDGRWCTVEMIIKTSILHEIVVEEVANWGHWVAAQADEVSVLDASQYSQLGLKLVDVLWEVVVQLLDRYGMAIFEATLVDSTWTSSSDNVLLTQVFCQVHHLFIRLRRHTKMEDHKTWWACSTIMYSGQVSQ